MAKEWRPVEKTRRPSFGMRLLFPAICLAGAVGATGCGFGPAGALPFRINPGGPTDPLTATDVFGIISTAAGALSDRTQVIAVVDRDGRLLGLFRETNAPATQRVLLAGQFIDADTNEFALSLARTGAFFSSDQAPLSSRTIQFISREHFPPTFGPNFEVTGVKNTPSGALWNIEGTNRGCPISAAFNPGQEIFPSRSVDGSAPGLGIATLPGGVPLYKFGKLVGGVGVCGVNPNAAEFAAGQAAAGFAPIVAEPGEIFIDGVRLPFIEQQNRPLLSAPDTFMTLTDAGAFVPIPDLMVPGAMIADVQGSPRNMVPEGWLIGPMGSPELSAAEVSNIVNNCVFRGNRTRGNIRLPLDARGKFVIAVGGLDGTILGLYRMPDATVFSIDVAATKARNAVYFSSAFRSPFDLPGVPPGTAVTARTLRFGSQPFYPPGISGTLPGPFFGLLLANYAAPCTQGSQPANPNQSGIVFFPGSAALYKFGVALVGGLGVSGDGVDQDDYVTAAGIVGYEPLDFLRADRVDLLGTELPYLRFPRAPEE